MPYFGAIVMLLWVAALIDVIVSDEHRVRHLPKMGWLVVVIIIPLAGSLIWFLVGRPVGASTAPSRTTGFPEYERTGRRLAQYPDDDDEFLRKCRERAEEQRRRAKGLDARNPSETPEDDA